MEISSKNLYIYEELSRSLVYAQVTSIECNKRWAGHLGIKTVNSVVSIKHYLDKLMHIPENQPLTTFLQHTFPEFMV